MTKHLQFFLSCRSSQVLNPGADVIGSNQGFAHQHGFGSGFQNLHDVLALMDSAFADDDFFGRNPAGQPLGHREIGREGFQIPVVDTDQGRIGDSFQGPVNFRFMMCSTSTSSAKPLAIE